MASLRIKAPDGKTLVIQVPPGTNPSQYPVMVDEVVRQYTGKNDQFKANAESIEPGVYGDTDPAEQKVVENLSSAANGAGAVYGGGTLLQGLGGLAAKGAGAIGEGMAPTLDKVGDWLGSRAIQFGLKNLPEDAIQAKGMVDEASNWAMNPHPEVQQAIMDISGGAPKAAVEAGEDIVPESESTIKQLSSGQKELPAPESPVSGTNMTETDSGVTGDEVPSELGLFDRPILSMDNPTTMSQLAHAQAQLKTVGKAIEDRLSSLTDTGKLYDPAATAKQLEGMYIRNASGKIIPPGEGSEQAMNNASVSKALETLKAEALDDNGLLHPLDWQRANAIKGRLWQLAEDTGDRVFQTAAGTVRDSIDDQAQQILAQQGENIAPFQMLRQAYSKLSNIYMGLNTNARSALGAKNAVPVVRTLAAGGGVATGHPGVAGVATADWLGRKYGTLAAARTFHNLAEAPEGLSELGSSMSEGTLKPAAKGILAGLAGDGEDDE